MKKLKTLFAIFPILLAVIGCNDTLDNSYFIPAYEYPEEDNGDDGDDNGDDSGEDTPDVPEVDEYSQMKVISFNIRTSGSDVGTSNAWEYRSDACCALLLNENPTVFGVQEAQSGQMLDLYEGLGYSYNYIGVGTTDGVTQGEFCGVFYKPDVVTLDTWRYFWFSETPDVPSSTWSTYYRTLTWAFFTHENGVKFLFMNTHLDLNADARAEEIPIIIDKIAELNPEGYPTVLMADFNTQDTDSVFDPLKEILYNARDTAPITDDYGTYQGWGTTSNVIDHIFYSGFNCLKFETIRDSYLGVTYVSDHYPVSALLEFITD